MKRPKGYRERKRQRDRDRERGRILKRIKKKRKVRN
jgi:hypothetical protein